MKKTNGLAIAVSIAFLVSPLITRGQSQEKIYSVMMLNFARGMKWPESFSHRDFVIGVLSYPPLTSELRKTLSSVKINNRSVVIEEYAGVEDIGKCHMIFVPAFKSRSFETILNRVADHPTLIVGNKTDLARRGAGVNFLLENGKVQYEINTKAIEQRGLKVSAGIKSLGKIVE